MRTLAGIAHGYLARRDGILTTRKRGVPEVNRLMRALGVVSISVGLATGAMVGTASAEAFREDGVSSSRVSNAVEAVQSALTRARGTAMLAEGVSRAGAREHLASESEPVLTSPPDLTSPVVSPPPPIPMCPCAPSPTPPPMPPPGSVVIIDGHTIVIDDSTTISVPPGGWVYPGQLAPAR